MSMTLSGNGTITGLVSGGLPDATITSAELASNAVDSQTLTLLNASGSAPVYACRAWVNFNGTGTVAISASGNVSSITDNGTGDYTVNFTTAMLDSNYSVVGSCTNNTYSTPADNSVRAAMPYSGTYPTGSIRMFCKFVNASNSGQEDQNTVSVAVFR